MTGVPLGNVLNSVWVGFVPAVFDEYSVLLGGEVGGLLGIPARVNCSMISSGSIPKLRDKFRINSFAFSLVPECVLLLSLLRLLLLGLDPKGDDPQSLSICSAKARGSSPPRIDALCCCKFSKNERAFSLASSFLQSSRCLDQDSRSLRSRSTLSPSALGF